MATQMVFKRYELKYVLRQEQYEALCRLMQAHMTLDDYGKHEIHNIYFDTEDFLLVRRSIEKPCYKEKLRVRSYGAAAQNPNVFIELKKKYNGVVYKRRLCLEKGEAFDFLCKGTAPHEETQITKELAYFMQFYKGLSPRVQLDYEREAFYGNADAEFRMTFDQNIRASSFTSGQYNANNGVRLLPKGQVLLEVKTAQGLPQWLLAFFSAEGIYKTSYSKVGTAYQKFLFRQVTEERAYVG